MAKTSLVTAALSLICLLCVGSVTGTPSNMEKDSISRSKERLESMRLAVTPHLEQALFTTAVPDNVEESEEDNNNMNSGEQNDIQSQFRPIKFYSLLKRAPNGFIGMRGKKDYDDLTSNPTDWSLDPVRLTQNAADENDDVGVRYKKTPTAFYGVRGKKYTNNDLNHLNEFLMQLDQERLRELLLQDFLDRLANGNAAQNEIAKRAPTGFTGMRGKRPAEYFDDDTLEKRTPTNGFVGVRGKKDLHHQYDKRSPAEMYKGRGRNQRFAEFTNKFVAVRGKKTPTIDLKDASWTPTETGVENTPYPVEVYERPIVARQRFLINVLPALLYDGKRTPSGFLGMRGKRAATTATVAGAAASIALAADDANTATATAASVKSLGYDQ